MRGAEVEALLAETAQRLAGRTWGVGILGFVPAELRDEQLDVVRRIKPPVALIAGGRPAQARPLEDLGIATFLHVPSPGLLDLFLKEGARRFVFEGRECGGHVGPRSSFALWEPQIARLLAHPAPAGTRGPVRRRHPRRPLGGDGRRDGRAAGRARRQDRRADGHRLPVHARGRRRRRDRARVPAGGDRLRRHGAARDRARPRHPLRRHRVRAGLPRRSARACSATACRRRRCGRSSRSSTSAACASPPRACSARATRSCASTPTRSVARACT